MIIRARLFVLVSFLSVSASVVFAQADSTSGKVASAKNFGIYGGASYSMLRLKSSPYFLNESESLGNVSVANSVGISGGIFLLFPSVQLRAAAEFNLMPCELIYETGKPNQEERMIYPLTVEIPISYLPPAIIKGKRSDLGLVFGGRFVFPITIVGDDIPVVSSFNFNIDGGIRIPLRLTKSDASFELIYSYGVLNLIDKDEENFRNKSVQTLGRDYIGLRLYFN